jgi:hypothetical protein
MTAMEPVLEFTSIRKGDRVFLICVECEHWIRRPMVGSCDCTCHVILPTEINYAKGDLE